jgi:hypothetical protein
MIFSTPFLSSTNSHRHLKHGLKPFWMWLRIRGENRLLNRRFSLQWCQWHRCDKKRSLVNSLPHICEMCTLYSSVGWFFKGTLTRDFRPLFFHQTTPPRPLIHGLTPFWIWLQIRGENRIWNRRFSSQWCQWHRCDKKRSLVTPLYFCLKVKGIVQDNLPMHVFLINMPVKGSQSHSKMRSNVTVVSYFHSGVNDLNVPCAAKSDCRLPSRIQSHIQKGFNMCIRDPGEVVGWKKQRSKISCQGPFKMTLKCF